MSLLGVDWSEFYDASTSKVPHDVMFKVMDPTDPPNFRIFSAHKLLLAAVSSCFKAQFYDGDHFDNTDEVLVQDTQPDAFEKFLKYIYHGKKVEIAPSIKFHDMKTIQLIFDVLILADKHLVQELRDICESLLLKSTMVTEDNMFDLVKLVDSSLHLTTMRIEMKKKCTEYLKENIGSYGSAFLQKLNNQPNFNFTVYRDLLSSEEETQEDDECEILSESQILETAEIKNSCTIS